MSAQDAEDLLAQLQRELEAADEKVKECRWYNSQSVPPHVELAKREADARLDGARRMLAAVQARPTVDQASECVDYP